MTPRGGKSIFTTIPRNTPPLKKQTKKGKFYIPDNILNDLNKKVDYKKKYEDELYRTLYEARAPKPPSYLRELPRYEPVKLEKFTSATGRTGYAPILDSTGELARASTGFRQSTGVEQLYRTAQRPRQNNFTETVRIESLPSSVSSRSRQPRLAIGDRSRLALGYEPSTASESVEDLGYAHEYYPDSPEPSEYGESGVFDFEGRRGRDVRGQFGSNPPSVVSTTRRDAQGRFISRKSSAYDTPSFGSTYSQSDIGDPILSAMAQSKINATPLSDAEVFGLSGQDIFGRDPMYTDAINFEE